MHTKTNSQTPKHFWHQTTTPSFQNCGEKVTSLYRELKMRFKKKNWSYNLFEIPKYALCISNQLQITYLGGKYQDL